MKYKANFKAGKNGNSIKGGSYLVVNVPGATVLTGIIAKKYPTKYGPFKKFVQVQQGTKQLKFLLKKKRKGKTVPFSSGNYVLTVRAFDSKNRGFGWKDVFYID